MSAEFPNQDAKGRAVTNDVTKPLPHAQGPEKSLLSSLLMHPHLLAETPGLCEELFYLPAHRLLFRKLAEMSAQGRPPELVGLVQELHDEGLLDDIGGPAAITEIYTYAPNGHHFLSHLERVKAKHVQRCMIELGGGLDRMARESPSIEEMVSALTAPVSRIIDLATGERGQTRSAREILGEVSRRYQDLCSGKVTPMGIETSLPEFNQRFRGLHGGQVVVLSGYPGGGKTTLASQLATDAALGGHTTLVVSLEMPARALMDRVLAYVAELPGDALADPLRFAREVSKTERPLKGHLDAIRAAMHRILDSPFTIEDLVDANVDRIAALIRREHRRRPLEVVVVDFVQRIRPVPDMRRESREQQLAHASNTLADLARELGFCLLLPSQLNKEGAAKHAEAINEDADLHLQICQDRTGESPTYEHTGLGVAKDRHCGHTGVKLPLVLDGPMLKFVPKPAGKG